MFPSAQFQTRSTTYPNRDGITEGHGTGWRLPRADGKWCQGNVLSSIVCPSQEETRWPNAEERAALPAAGSSSRAACPARSPSALAGAWVTEGHGRGGTRPRPALAPCVRSTKRSRRVFAGNSCPAGQQQGCPSCGAEVSQGRVSMNTGCSVVWRPSQRQRLPASSRS